jgi:hypothetical protein
MKEVMMRNELMSPLKEILTQTHLLLSEPESDLTDQQMRFIESICAATMKLRDLIISVPEAMLPRAMSSYQVRAYLTSIVGCADEMLYDTAPQLNTAQTAYVRDIHSTSKSLLGMTAQLQTA